MMKVSLDLERELFSYVFRGRLRIRREVVR